jgi:hypothetical protein
VQFVELTTKEKVLASEPERDEVSAGINRLEKFGSFGTVYHLAGKSILSMPDIYNLKYIDVFAFLYYEKEQSEYQSKLLRIKSKK